MREPSDLPRQLGHSDIHELVLPDFGLSRIMAQAFVTELIEFSYQHEGTIGAMWDGLEPAYAMRAIGLIGRLPVDTHGKAG